MPMKRIDTTLKRHGTVGKLLPDPAPAAEAHNPFDTDEWDPSRMPFWHHAVAGSFAGVTEHSVMFPMDTLKTHLQVGTGTRVTFAEMVQAQGMPRMWRGVQTMFVGCIPAHAAYFSIYESLKPSLITAATASAVCPDPEISTAIGAGLAVSLATVAHDLIMTPMDVMKQRLQLGYHSNKLSSVFSAIMREQGPRAFVVSLPTTLAMNMPHAGVLGTANEYLKRQLTPAGAESPGVLAHFLAGGAAGAIAAAATQPLDAIKTRLQTQHLPIASAAGSCSATAGLAYLGPVQACAAVFREAGVAGFYRGVLARMLAHAPSVAICWTTYETVKAALDRTDPR